ncbi:hypothetical protein DFH08DRAFT_1046685 [Mycena albidolilacea]|uniref:Uncharacterized protein n=1 Tax=Mycena albidolilacea TaxID=1033008 RepID=A0AAD6Z6K5_9AGAR|nr:hypothetical protein DFH08DRAFT_1046685 [Mycena albidolilacea]
MGMTATGIGYIRCFKIVQSATNGAGLSIWLGLEIILSLLRMGMRAVNPTTDDPLEPITILEKAPHEAKKFCIGCWRIASSLWTSMPLSSTSLVNLVLGVLQQQVYHLLEPNAQVIEQTLRALAERTDIRNGSPITIYVSDHTNTQRPWRIGDQELELLYSSFFNLIRLIAQNKGDNVVIMLNASYPGLEPDVAINLEMQPFVILAACSEGLVAAVDDDEHLGLFTKSLIALLKSSKFEELTYQGLIARVQLGTTRTEMYSGWVASGGWSVVAFMIRATVTEVTASVGISSRTGFGASFGMTRFSGTSVETETRPDWPRPSCIGAMKNRPIFSGLKKSVQTSVDSERSVITLVLELTIGYIKLLTQVKNSRVKWSRKGLHGSNPNLTDDYIGEQFRIGPRSIDIAYIEICTRYDSWYSRVLRIEFFEYLVLSFERKSVLLECNNTSHERSKWTRKKKVQPSSLWCKLESNGRARLAWISMPSLWISTGLQFENEFLGESLHYGSSPTRFHTSDVHVVTTTEESGAGASMALMCWRSRDRISERESRQGRVEETRRLSRNMAYWTDSLNSSCVDRVLESLRQPLEATWWLIRHAAGARKKNQIQRWRASGNKEKQ